MPHELNQRTKQLLTAAGNDPWQALKWDSSRTDEFIGEFIKFYDDVAFELQKNHRVMEYATILNRLALSRCSRARTRACLGSAYRIMGSYSQAESLFKESQKICDCTKCRIERLKRVAALRAFQGKFDPALILMDECVELAKSESEYRQCEIYILRSAYQSYVARNSEGLDDATRANELLTMGIEVSSRFYITLYINTINLAAGCSSTEIDRAALILKSSRSGLVGATAGDGVPPIVRAYLRWTIGLLYFQMGDFRRAVEKLESAVSSLARIMLRIELLAARADLAIIRAKAPRPAHHTHHIKILLEASLSLVEEESKTKTLLVKAIERPSPELLIEWRNTIPARVPNIFTVPPVRTKAVSIAGEQTTIW